MAKDFSLIPTCNIKVDVYLNRDGNICQEGETPTAQKTITFSGIKSDITIDEAINTDDSEALHNGVAGLIWLFTGSDENFDELSVRKVTTEIVEED